MSGTFAVLFASIFIFGFGIPGVSAVFDATKLFTGELELGPQQLAELLFGMSFLLGPLIALGWLFKIFSVHRLRVQHSTDLLVFDSTFRGRSWRVKERRLSESLYLRYDTWTELHGRKRGTHAGEPLNVANNRNQVNGSINERIWIMKTDKVSVPSLNRCQVSPTR